TSTNMRRHLIAAAVASVLGVLIGTALWWFFPQRKTADPAIVTGTVADEFGPVGGALVQIAGGDTSAITGQDGRFRLPGRNGSAMVTAIKAGYFISIGSASEPQLRLTLRKLPTADHEEYRWNPDRCMTCHTDIHNEWRSSAHGFGNGVSRFQQLFH